MMGILSLWLLASVCIFLQVTKAQNFMIRNIQLEKCIHAAEDTGRVSLAKCKVNSHHQYWSWDLGTNFIINVLSNKCLTVMKSHNHYMLKIAPCEGRRNQVWMCDQMGYLTLYGHNLHLSAKQGTKKVSMSSRMDKFSKWKMLQDSPVCGESHPPRNFTPISHLEQSTKRDPEEVTTVPYESKSGNIIDGIKSSPHLPYMSEWTTTAATHIPGQAYTTDSGDEQFASSWERLTEKIYVLEEDGSGWRTAMLVLSPFTFILGVIILVLNVRVNKKRKLLSALPSHVKPHHKFGSSYEQSPLTAKLDQSDYPGPDSSAPTLRHGEILIEWKDGTITPLYDHQ
ncbi:uncharacterized protein LOC122924817 [Bufo gargarizans]|uniref:uncharacterized protein LOC122924817 n=1 Tax=Bufo gargarizans TaxID=30331 RepID=UPI001CF5B0B7|nr:uncharacterized protein LOC122924817 [Bufo gargarizans]